jgi:hypothetical protein
LPLTRLPNGTSGKQEDSTATPLFSPGAAAGSFSPDAATITLDRAAALRNLQPYPIVIQCKKRHHGSLIGKLITTLPHLPLAISA